MTINCDGQDGAAGPAGPQGEIGPAGSYLVEDGQDGQDYDPATNVQPESCLVCHGETGQEEHQAVYDDYLDGLNDSKLALEILGIDSVADGAGAFDVTMTVEIMENGAPYIDGEGLPGMDQKRFYVNGYDSATGTYPGALNKRLNDSIVHDRDARGI